MKDCFKRYFLPCAAFIFFSSAFLGSCVDVDNELGLGLLPDDQEMIFSHATIGGVRSYMSFSDSLPVSQLGIMALGNYRTDGLGHIRSGAAVQFTPGWWADSEGFHGHKPYFDSLKLYLQVATIYGDTEKDQKFYIYRLTKELPHSDSTVYGEFDPTEYYDINAPLYSFVMKDVETGVYTPELEAEPAAADFVQELLYYDYDNDYEIYTNSDRDSLFRKDFYGLYITPSHLPSEAPEDAALYFISPITALDEYYYVPVDYTYFQLYYRTHYKSAGDVPDDETKVEHVVGGETLYVKDTLSTSYTFDDMYLTRPNTNIMVIERDYSGADFDPDTDFVYPETFVSGSLPSRSPIYIQGMFGVAGYLDFGQEFLDELWALATPDGEERILHINRARLYMWLDDDRNEAMDDAPTRLGMYYTYSGYYPLNIPDYYYYYEQTNSVESGYLGYLNRAMGYYETDISTYLRDLLADEDTPRQIWLGPGHTTAVFTTPTQVKLQNPWSADAAEPLDTQIQLKLTYTLLKKTIDE